MFKLVAVMNLTTSETERGEIVETEMIVIENDTIERDEGHPVRGQDHHVDLGHQSHGHIVHRVDVHESYPDTWYSSLGFHWTRELSLNSLAQYFLCCRKHYNSDLFIFQTRCQRYNIEISLQ